MPPSQYWRHCPSSWIINRSASSEIKRGKARIEWSLPRKLLLLSNSEHMLDFNLITQNRNWWSFETEELQTNRKCLLTVPPVTQPSSHFLIQSFSCEIRWLLQWLFTYTEPKQPQAELKIFFQFSGTKVREPPHWCHCSMSPTSPHGATRSPHTSWDHN